MAENMWTLRYTTVEDPSNYITITGNVINGYISKFPYELAQSFQNSNTKLVNMSLIFPNIVNDISSIGYIAENGQNGTFNPSMYFNKAENIENFYDLSNCKTMFYSGFESFTSLKSINNIYNTVNIQNMRHLFSGCYSLTEIPNFNTSNVTNMTYMFNCCYNLINVPNFNTINVKDMSYTFKECHNLIELPELVTSNVTSLDSTFLQCYNLTTISNLNTSNVTSMRQTFTHCNNLITIPNFNTSKVTYMEATFAWCSNLRIIPKLNTYNVIHMNSMFESCSNLISVPAFSTASAKYMNYMFYGCLNLSNESLENIASSLPYTSQLVGNPNSLTTYLWLSQDQVNYISTTKYASQLQEKGWNITRNYGHEPRIKKIKSKITNNLFSTYYIGMDAKYVNITSDTLNFLTENITVDELYGYMTNYLNKQINIKYRAFDISYDLGDINSLVEDRVYYDHSKNGENLRDYIETIPNNCCNLSIIEIAAPYFDNAAYLFELPQS